MKKIALLQLLVLFFANQYCSAQYANKTDSVIKIIMGDEHVTDLNDKGITLLSSGNLSAAGAYFEAEIKKDEGAAKAYFGRGLVHWVTQDTLSACKDWSALLALGDTAAFKLLDGRCHGAMTIDNDVIPKSKYHTLFAAEKKGSSTLSSNEEARTMADEMPQFSAAHGTLPGYLKAHLIYPLNAKAKKVHGTVYVSFIVSSKGKVLFPRVTRGIGSGCDEEALRIIRTMPAWTSGKQKGKPVLVKYTLPVIFALK